MVTMPIGLLVFIICLCVCLGALFVFDIFHLANLLLIKSVEKQFILKYIKEHKRGNELPTKLIYKYLSKEEKQNILHKRGEK